MSETIPALEKIAEIGRLSGLSPADPIHQPLAAARATARAYQQLWNTPLPEIDRVETVDVARPGLPPLSLRLHFPDTSRSRQPVLLYFHGGGFVLNGVDTHERLMRLLAIRSGATVIGVSYTLAPELRFPGQIHEALSAYDWVRTNGPAFGLDPARIALGGDSAGANLALATSLALRDAGKPAPKAGLLLYGMFSAKLTSPSHRAFGGGGFGLTTERMQWFWDQYLPDPKARTNPLASLVLAELGGLPHQTIIAAGLDCLRDDSVDLARRLETARVPHTLSVYGGVPHSFMQMSAHLPAADDAIHEAARAMRIQLADDSRQAAE